ncbi:unnamed protein product [Rotaria sp. Silwood2]|nr:unnamed protein product [Rotaria sp. Silwood2]CAF3174058.1 unnamed protein product [Rotaria sp. Silwood2]CAF3400140.1 unnamed protein product [Rotaria sp. Silwood2]CAF3468316.1 unnamed protein product [Rotaria sp. Silwood2]CAF4389941.1 unnamed protein product [Rotaria sp. Silwood2]
MKAVYASIESVSNAIKRDARRWDLSLISISIVTSTDDFNKLDQSFMYSQLLTDIIRKLEDDHGEAKKRFVKFLRRQYAGNNAQLKIIDEFERDYYLHSPVWWYTRDIFMYSMINQALRTQDIEILMKMGFFMRDLHLQIEQLHDQQFKNKETLIVYRGQRLSTDDFAKVRNNIGGLLSFNNFMSTSAQENVGSSIYAESARQDPDTIAIFFRIRIDSAVTSVPFASVNDTSYFESAEDEIILSMHTIFRIDDVKFLADRLWEVQLSSTSDNDQQLKHLTQTIEKEIQGGIGWHRLGRLLIRLAKYEQAEEIYKELLDWTPDTNYEEISTYYIQLAYISDENGNLLNALEYYLKAQRILQQFLPSDDPRVTIVESNIGGVYRSMGDYSKALLSMQNVLRVREKSLPSDDIQLASTYNNMGEIYRSMKDYSNALYFYEKALKIFQEKLPSIHPTLAICYNNIADVCHYMGKFSSALFFCEKVLEIQQRSLPPDHPDLAVTYNNLGRIHQSKGELLTAISFYQKTIAIRKKRLSEDHLDMALTYNHIGLLYQSIGDYNNAISFQSKTLEIQEKNLISTHPNLANAYKNLAKSYQSMGDYIKALPLYQKVIDIGEKFPFENHLSLSFVYNNMGQIYHSSGDYTKALVYYQQALKVSVKYLSENHPLIAVTYFNQAKALEDLGHHQAAIENYERAIDIGRHSFEPNDHRMLLFQTSLQTIRQNLRDQSLDLSNS